MIHQSCGEAALNSPRLWALDWCTAGQMDPVRPFALFCGVKVICRYCLLNVAVVDFEGGALWARAFSFDR